MATSAKVRIAARLRPRLPGEAHDDAVRVCHGEEDASCGAINVNGSGNTSGNSSGGSGFTGIAVANPRDASQVFRFPFTSCYDATATQAALFDADVRPLVDVALGGVTVTIFAYGVTSSGKTHTMQGTPEDPGVIPRVVEALFDPSTHSATHSQPEVGVSYIEIYKDDVYDLLVQRENAPKLPVRENDMGAVFVAGLTTAPVGSVSEFGKVYATATARRSVGATLLNRASSRSHAVLTLNLKVRVLDAETGGERMREGKINLVDLAGSENNKLTGNDPSRMAESAAINKSLSVLGQVVHALNTGAPRIPYRNAKLTRILQDALGGSSVGLLICNLAPGAKWRQDTLNTLNFAVRTKNIENRPVINEREIRPPPPPAPKIDLAQVAPAARVAAAAGAHSALNGPRPSVAGAGGRPSLVPRPAQRTSTFGLPGAGAPFSRMSVIGGVVGADVKDTVKEKVKEQVPPGLSEAEIDARISRAVEAEVARRLEEREREREAEREREREREREMELQAGPSRRSPRKDRDSAHSRSPRSKELELPPGLSPLLRRHKDLDDELQARLQELERKFERGNKEMALADVLSPVSKKKTGRAYVALARQHSDRGDLQIALDLYRRAETYVPDNVKLKERIIEIEWAVKNNTGFKPSPKRPKKKGKKEKEKAKQDAPEMDVDGADANRSEAAHEADAVPREEEREASDDQMEVDEVETSLTGRAAFGHVFGSELTNTGGKRTFEDTGMETPAKRSKRSAAGKKRVVVIESDDEDEFVPAAAPRKSRRRIGGAA
ncbi:kinesin-like protein [Mycena crocata]|nr:kinesin-like protein [Mycena crocata]